MKVSKLFILLCSISAVYCGGPSRCEPFVSNFHAFQQVWTHMTELFENLVLNVASSYPIFTPAIIGGLECRLSSAIEFPADVISRLSGVNAKEVVDIINGTSTPDFGSTLDCVGDDLNDMQRRIFAIFEHLIPYMWASPESTPNDCDEVFSRIKPLFLFGPAFSKQLGEVLRYNRESYSSLGIEDLYLNNLIPQAPCLLSSVSEAFGAFLNCNGSIVAQYFYDESIDLPFPFSCLEPGLNVVRRNAIQWFIDLYSGKITSFDFQIPS
ncbi:uncharacterized protein [Chironomus tepperi]|uniref:uncharacterized protein n=1 Tax=Chironomus tepperi TaxID=113505 RepID=UPI00391FC91F